MRFFPALDEVPAGFGPSAVTFGKFDGLHVGHRAIVDTLTAAARARSLTSTVVTFDRNPLSLLAPERNPRSLVSSRRKVELFDDAGVDAMVQLRFDLAFSRMPADDFIRTVLVDALDARVVLVGPGTRFGAGGRGTFDTLVEAARTMGFDVERLDPVGEGSEPVSSTRIRGALDRGEITDAARWLGRLPSVRGIVVHGQKRGRELGYPTANLSPDLEGFIPADGVYAGYLSVAGERLPAAISIGNNPTFEGVPQRQVEAHVLDADLDLYDLEVEVEFVDRIRGMEKFDSLPALITQMDNDTVRVRAALASHGGGSVPGRS
ncbi:bifunctional riboflavin kinase/FAD synthetase [Marisediminicola sp. LYQ134]|uniref:bifunctional riboflavin kinase/FAD synthetase n=1 Tax=Marisediminicola sp. LYQ134 TaxID=3391061 RepID=UPI00398346A2